MISSYFTESITRIRLTDLAPDWPGSSVSGDAVVYRARVTNKTAPVRGRDGSMLDASYSIRVESSADLLVTDTIVLGDVSAQVVSGVVSVTDYQWKPILISQATGFDQNHKRVIV